MPDRNRGGAAIRMNHELHVRDYFLQPGYLCVPPEPTRLAVVVASGVALTLFDPARKRGGMGHYIRPRRERGASTTHFAAPAIVSLVEMMTEAGTEPPALEAHIYGGAVGGDASARDARISAENIKVAEELLAKLAIPIAGRDVGGARARKILFNTGTGEVVVARVERVRASDWYPDPFRTQDRGGAP